MFSQFDLAFRKVVINAGTELEVLSYTHFHKCVSFCRRLQWSSLARSKIFPLKVMLIIEMIAAFIPPSPPITITVIHEFIDEKL